MTNDELYIQYLTLCKSIAGELGAPQDKELLHYQTLLQLSYITAGSKDLKNDDLFVRILRLNDIIKNYKIH